jgi:hypothetical protein
VTDFLRGEVPDIGIGEKKRRMPVLVESLVFDGRSFQRLVWIGKPTHSCLPVERDLNVCVCFWWVTARGSDDL